MLVFPYLYGSGGGGGSDFTYTMSNDGEFQYPPNVIIPNNVTILQPNTLGYCSHNEIQTIIWQAGSTMTTIPNSTFQSCTGLTEITIPSNITSLGASTFNYCSNLTTVNIAPNARIKYGGSNFYFCNKLSNTSAENIIASIDTTGSNLFYCCSGLTSISVPSGATTLGISMFYGCSSFAYIYLPKTIVTGTTGTGSSQVFYGCKKLTDIELENGWNCSLVISYPTLTSVSLKAMFESLLDLTGDTAKTLTLGTTNLTTASTTTYIPEGSTDPVPIASIAMNKNWTLTS